MATTAMALPRKDPRSFRLGLWLGTLHFVAFLMSAVLAQQGQGWAGVYVWPIWLLIDFPWSVLHLVIGHPLVDSWIEGLRSHYTLLSYLLYSPYLVHGIVGTVWWVFVPNIYFRYRRPRA